jgi:hypothetical protein
MPIKTWPEFKEDAKELFNINNIRRFGVRWFLRNLVNLVDDYPDWVKEKLHGMKLPFGYELNISFFMRNRPTTWNIIRKQGDYFNDDPEDLEQ